MIDTVTLVKPGIFDEMLGDRLVRAHDRTSRGTGATTLAGFVDNLSTKVYPDGNLVVCGSLAQFHKGNNVFPLQPEEISDALTRLEDRLQVHLADAWIKRLDFGNTFVTRRPPAEYIACMVRMKGMKRDESGPGETLLFKDKHGHELTIYDKRKQMADTRASGPRPAAGKFFTRVEERLSKREGLVIGGECVTVARLSDRKFLAGLAHRLQATTLQIERKFDFTALPEKCRTPGQIQAFHAWKSIDMCGGIDAIRTDPHSKFLLRKARMKGLAKWSVVPTDASQEFDNLIADFAETWAA